MDIFFLKLFLEENWYTEENFSIQYHKMLRSYDKVVFN